MSKPPVIHVRRARVTDLEALLDFNVAIASETEQTRLDRTRLTAGIQALFSSSDKGFYTVAECAGRVVGCMLITYEWSDWRNATWWWIQSVYVAPDMRRRGVYTALHRAIEAEARGNPGVCGLRLYVDRDNKSAQSVYSKLGLRQSRYDFFELGFVALERESPGSI